MTEGGRSMVWNAVMAVLKRYSDQGRIGTNQREIRVKRVKDWEPGMGEPITGGIFSGESTAEFREALMDGARANVQERYYRLSKGLLEDIASEVSADIEKRLTEWERGQQQHTTSQPQRPPWLHVVNGGADDQVDEGHNFGMGPRSPEVDQAGDDSQPDPSEAGGCGGVHEGAGKAGILGRRVAKAGGAGAEISDLSIIAARDRLKTAVDDE